MKYSIIVPVYNRPDEIDELLQSVCQQTITDFEVIVVEDGDDNRIFQFSIIIFQLSIGLLLGASEV